MELGFKGLSVYKLAYKLSMEIYRLSKNFPKEEIYSLTDQIRRSSRSVCTNIGEGYRKKKYPKHFSSKMTDADSECTETLIWLDFAKDCEYLSLENHESLCKQYTDVGRMLGAMAEYPERFTPKNRSNT
jgi:four helix bundle protein